MIQRMIRAARLEVALYEEVEHDPGATIQAMGVVLLSSLAAGIGGIAVAGGLRGLVLGSVSALVGWLLWAFITYFIGTRLFPTPETEATYGQLLRTIGFSSSPGVIRVLGVVPFLTGAVNLIAPIWMLVAMVIAVRQALDYTSTWRAVGVVLVGWLIQFIVFFGVVLLAGGA